MDPRARNNPTLQRLLRLKGGGGLGFLDYQDYYEVNEWGDWYYRTADGAEYWGYADGSGGAIDAYGIYGTDGYGNDYFQGYEATGDFTLNNPTEPGGLPTLPDNISTSPDGLTWGGTSDWLARWWDELTGGPALPDYGPAGTGAGLPGYCGKGTYHPINDPLSCVPFPPNDPAANRAAKQQQQQQQKQAQAAKAQQKKADQQCPKDPQGRPVFFNQKTGKCELVPPCQQGMKFDPATGRCLTAAQSSQLYGETNWWMWAAVIAAAYALGRR